MIRVVCLKWTPRSEQPSRPPWGLRYGAEHVNTLRSMVRRHLSMEHEFVCITDKPAGLDAGIRVVPMWEDGVEHGACYAKLRTFSGEMEDLIGPRFVVLDLDCVVTGALDPLFDRPDDFVINSYKRGASTKPQETAQLYNSGMYMMDAGARSRVWEGWKGEESVRKVADANRRRSVIGSDQAWIRMVLGESEARWTEDDGVYEYRQARSGPPDGARIIFFAGPRDPTTVTASWIREHYR